MAYVKFSTPTNLDNAQTWYGCLLVANDSHQIVISDGYNSTYYYGSFAYSNNQVAGGVLTGVVNYSGGLPTSGRLWALGRCTNRRVLHQQQPAAAAVRHRSRRRRLVRRLIWE